VAVRAETYALARPVPYLLEQGYADAASSSGQTIQAPIRATGDGALVAPTQAGSTVTITDANGSEVVSEAAVTVSGDVASYTFAAGAPSTAYALGDGWTVTWALVIAGEVYTYRHGAILAQYVPRNVITAADLYGGDGFPELRHAVPQAQGERGDGTGWAPQIDAAYYDLIRRMLRDGRPIWRSREPTGYRGWLLARALKNAADAIPAPEGSQWARLQTRAYHRFRVAEGALRLSYDDDAAGVRRPGEGPIYTAPVGRPRW